MCFSAEASFTSGAVLAVIGVAAFRQCTSSRQFFFASIPIMLALQQFTEGYLWLSFSGRGSPFWQQTSGYVFLFFAQVVWPFWIPISIARLEKKEKRRTVLKGILGVGGVVSLYFGYRLITQPLEIQAVGHHISYAVGTPGPLATFFGVLYFVCTVSPSLIAANKTYLFGLSISISYLFSAFFFEHYIISVWCFFATISSVSVWFILFDLGKRISRSRFSKI